jgi:hypothetical protein
MMRMMLYEGAQSMLLHSAKWSWLKAWAMKIARHRGMKKAIVASGASVGRDHAPHVGWRHRVLLDPRTGHSSSSIKTVQHLIQ